MPESGGDFTRRFAFELRRDFDFLLRLLTSKKLSGPEAPRPCLLWGVVCIKCLINSRKKREFSKKNPHKRRHFFRPHFVYNSAISVVHFHWSRLTRDNFRFLHYLPSLHVYGAAGSRHKNDTMAEKATAFSHIKTQSDQAISGKSACSQTSFTRMTLKQFCVISTVISIRKYAMAEPEKRQKAETGICGPRSLLTAHPRCERIRLTQRNDAPTNNRECIQKNVE